MAKTLVINLPDDLEQALTAQAEQLNQSPEEVALQMLSQQLAARPQPQTAQSSEDDSLLRLIGSLHVDIPDLAENHDYYIGQALYLELAGDEVACSLILQGGLSYSSILNLITFKQIIIFGRLCNSAEI